MDTEETTVEGETTEPVTETTTEETTVEPTDVDETESEDATDAEQTEPVAPLEHVDPTTEKAPVAESTAVFTPEDATDAVVFHVNDISTPTREFSEEDHGSSWKELALEFFQNHSHKITAVDHL